jgi:hypothetical protein
MKKAETEAHGEICKTDPCQLCALIKQATEAADYIEDMYRSSFLVRPKKSSLLVKDHAILKPLRAAIAALKATLR